MPVIIDGPVPARWAERKNDQLGAHTQRVGSDALKIALVNNMPDSALEDTELQFIELLDFASDALPVHLKLFSLPNVPREQTGAERLKNFYCSVDELPNHRFDGVIITGTEPRTPNLKNEPYWAALCALFEWAEHNTASAVLSCLAAHAGVLYSDGIPRHPLKDKKFGIFDCSKQTNHTLMPVSLSSFNFPHSRWNELHEEELTSAGYTILTKSDEAGVDAFVKRKHRSLFLHFQGHPEYDPLTLFKEYRRDIRRFLRQERETYPNMPIGYFGETMAKTLGEFCEKALQSRTEAVMDLFPGSVTGTDLKQSWKTTSTLIYRNWLQFLCAARHRISIFPSAKVLSIEVERKRSVAQ